jgi:hypothetical protein
MTPNPSTNQTITSTTKNQIKRMEITERQITMDIITSKISRDRRGERNSVVETKGRINFILKIIIITMGVNLLKISDKITMANTKINTIIKRTMGISSRNIIISTRSRNQCNCSSNKLIKSAPRRI